MRDDVDGILETNGLTALTREQEGKIRDRFALEKIRPVVQTQIARKVKKSETVEDLVAELGGQNYANLTEGLAGTLVRSIALPPMEQSLFLDGLREGYELYLKPDGSFAGDKRRLEIYLLLLAHCFEIEKMRKKPGGISRPELLAWLEEQHGADLGKNQHQFDVLCDGIGLFTKSPGRTRKK